MKTHLCGLIVCAEIGLMVSFLNGCGKIDRGDKPLAIECLAWVLAHTPREGQLPEQIDPRTGEPSWVMPLTWSHAMFVLACADISEDIWSSAVQAASALSKTKNTSTRGL